MYTPLPAPLDSGHICLKRLRMPQAWHMAFSVVSTASDAPSASPAPSAAGVQRACCAVVELASGMCCRLICNLVINISFVVRLLLLIMIYASPGMCQDWSGSKIVEHFE